VKLFENPVFLTHWRLTRRTGILAPAIISILVGSSLLAGLIASLLDTSTSRFRSPQDCGRAFYGWVIALEMLVLLLGGFAHIWSALAEDRKSGLLDSHRMTPQTPADLVIGYWCGAPLREFGMGALLALFGVPVVLLAKLPFSLWLISQMLVASTTALFWLLALLAGLTLDRAVGMVLMLVLVVSVQLGIIASPQLVVTGQLLPVQALASLFADETRVPQEQLALFGFSVHPILVTWGLQIIVGALFWRATVRRFAEPTDPLFSRREGLALLALLVGCQHALIWSPNHGGPSGAVACHAHNEWGRQFMLGVTQGAALLMGLFAIALLSPTPEQTRILLLRRNVRSLGIVVSTGPVLLAVQLAAVVGLLLGIQFAPCLGLTWKAYATASLNTFEIFFVFGLWLEVCRLQFRKRALGYFGLGLFIVAVLPYVLAAAFSSDGLGRLSLLSPGFGVLMEPEPARTDVMFLVALSHLLLVGLLILVWHNRWGKVLARLAREDTG
jgi:hypothetical protein